MPFSPTVDNGVASRTRAVLAKMPAPVVVVTAYVGGRPWGATVSSFTPMTLDPPTVSVCLFSHTAVVQAARVQGRMGISVLASDQVATARAAAAPGAPKYLDYVCAENAAMVDDGAPVSLSSRRWDPHDGLTVPAAPAVHGALAHFDCWVIQTVKVGDHDLLIGSVAEVHTSASPNPPLLYAGRNFYSLAGARPLAN